MAEIPVDIAEGVTAMLRGVFAGSRGVETAAAALRFGRRQSAHPNRYAVAQARAELNFAAESTQSRQFLWLDKSKKRPSFEVRVSAKFEPGLDPVERSTSAGETLMVVPQFLDCTGDAHSLDFRCASGEIVRVDLADSGTIGIRATRKTTIAPFAAALPEGTPGGGSPAMLLPPPSEWPMDAIVGILDTIAEWRRGTMSSRHLPFDLAQQLGGGLDALLATIRSGCSRVSQFIESEYSAHPEPSGLQVAAISATIRAYLSDEAQISEGPQRPESSLALDLVLSPGAVLGDGEALLAFDLPDFLVEGPLHQQFLAALRDVPSKIKDALQDSVGNENTSQIEALLESSRNPGSASVVRISQDDTDLVLLHGLSADASAGLLLEVKFTRPEGERPVVDEKTKIRVVAHRERSTWTGSDDDAHGKLKAPYYFERLLRTLHGLQRCVAAGLLPARRTS